jgi:hypothetical protein
MDIDEVLKEHAVHYAASAALDGIGIQQPKAARISASQITATPR